MILGVREGVIVILGVVLGVIEGVTEGVTLGVLDGVSDTLGVMDGVTLGVVVIDGVSDGVTETHCSVLSCDPVTNLRNIPPMIAYPLYRLVHALSS